MIPLIIVEVLILLAWNTLETVVETQMKGETMFRSLFGASVMDDETRMGLLATASGTTTEKKSGTTTEKKTGLPITDPNWQWSIYDQYVDKKGQLKLTKRAAETSPADVDGGPFRVIYRHRDQQWPDIVQIILSSRSLCKIIEQHLPSNGDLKTLEEPKIDGRELCIVLDDLKSHRFNSGGGRESDSREQSNGNAVFQHSGFANDDSINPHEPTQGEVLGQDDSQAGTEKEGELHLKHLVRFMEKEYKDVPVRVQRMREEKQVVWDLLWAFLPSGKRVVYSCDHSEELLYATVSTNYFQQTMAGWYFVLDLDIWEFDGRSYRKCSITRQIKEYEGERSFAGLAVCPVELIGPPEVLEERFLDNGKKYFDLAITQKHRFMHYTGPLFQKRKDAKSCWQLHKENADGRVMIDLASFAKMNPYYPMGNAQPPTASKSWARLQNGSFTLCSAPGESFNSSIVDTSEVSNENLIFAPGIVYGFSFTLKLWGSFAINGFRDISFDSNAFDELVMEPQIKSLVRNLVSHYIASPVDGSRTLKRVDPISNKGNGCVFLCYGPPGTGQFMDCRKVLKRDGHNLCFFPFDLDLT